ncbi:MAG: class I SAM-dependent DNA methyltransferase [Verrucomicrobiae bacterium]|nr:class I SAM-dependent DNA methyltransferase [Verrucomicrobiae bacterium]
MNAVEIEEAVSRLAEQPFDAESFPFAFLEAFGNKSTTLQRLKSGSTNQSDIGGVLQRSNIHIKVCGPGEVTETLKALRESKKTVSQKAKFILATDGVELQAESLEGEGETLACEYPKVADHFGFFLPLAGISTVRQIRENAFDIKATGRLNRLYIELLKDNPEWATAARREDLNHFMARVIFCFFAEDTNIFRSEGLFTATVDQMSARDSSNTHEVISELFRAMNSRLADREKAKIKPWANVFPYVNGGLFSDSVEVPRFSKIARSYLLHVGNLDWTKINPDIFGSMIQAVADDEERGALGMHYTSVPNILKVLNPLFLDELRARLEEAGQSTQKLLNLRKRIARIRVFDPACGSGNFLVIAYKQLREIEAEINRRRGEADRKSEIPLTNFRGIEIRHFSCEIARLALIIAEYQCDVIYRGQQLALAEFLPLEAANWITCGNALRLDWLGICPPTGRAVKNRADDLFETSLVQAEIDFENEGGETYICGNPPYAGLSSQNDAQKEDLRLLFTGISQYWKSFDYVFGWFKKAEQCIRLTQGAVAFVTTNSVCQGQQVPMFWPLVLRDGIGISFAHTSFAWSNLAAHNAGVTVAVIGLSSELGSNRKLYYVDDFGETNVKTAENINAYLVPGPNTWVEPVSAAPADRPTMYWGNKPTDGGFLILEPEEATELKMTHPESARFIKSYYGSTEFIRGNPRACIWVEDNDAESARAIGPLNDRFIKVRDFRASSKAKETRPAAAFPHRFRQIQGEPGARCIVVPIHTSESRDYLPVGLLTGDAIISNAAYALYNADTWSLAIIASRLHLVWIGTVCGKLKTDYRYSSTLGWNTFPLPSLTEKNKADLAGCASEILLARESHFPATIADLYTAKAMPENLREAHNRNDETLERIYIGRRFRNDTERLETLFKIYDSTRSRKCPQDKKKARLKRD